jgi:glycine/D-amino acid oxidase-like deaminating enzyme
MKILIIGQGIAGTMLAHILERAGVQVVVAEANLPGRSSEVAAGIVNPVTGKRFVKSWRLDDFFLVAQYHYRALESLLGISVWEERPILRLLATPEEKNDWATRCAQTDYTEYMGERPNAGAWAPFLKPGFHIGVIHKAARVNFPTLLHAFREKARINGQLIDTPIQYGDIETLLGEYDRVVFCEGYRASENPYFPNLPWQLAKGEALLIRFQDSRANQVHDMLKKTSLIAPLGDGLFWAGGSYQWHYPDLDPSLGERDYILQRLGEMLQAPFEVVGHVAGVRPSVKDRRPFLGESQVLSRVYIFNGLGTKGALLAPFWAEHLADHLLKGTPLDTTVAVGR